MLDTSQVYQRLKEAIGSGEVFAIRYHGGSQPGAHREIEPLAMVGSDKVRARCRTSSSTKTFNLEKIEILKTKPTSEAVGRWSTDAPHGASFATVTEIEAAHRDSLEAIGWHVVRSEQEGNEWLSLFKKGKTGKTLKYATIVLSFEPMTFDAIVTRNGEIEHGNVRPRARPWSVRGPSGGLGTWSNSSKALAAFLRVAGEGP